MLRTFGTEVLVCPRCGGRREVLAAGGPSAEVPGFLSARSPPRQRELEFDGQAVGSGWSGTAG